MNISLNAVLNSYKVSKEENYINNKEKTDNDFCNKLNKTDSRYVDEIKEFMPVTTVHLKSMSNADVNKFYEQWRKQSTNTSAFSHEVVISPKVLEKMNNDPKYAEKMMADIKKAATPVGFENATLYEYKVIVSDNGDIKIFAAASFHKFENNNKNDDKKNDDKDDLVIEKHLMNLKREKLRKDELIQKRIDEKRQLEYYLQSMYNNNSYLVGSIIDKSKIFSSYEDKSVIKS